ncbi:integrase, catalytic region, zinc finger, CCHC-type containing protein [Tanacetum coccineum]
MLKDSIDNGPYQFKPEITIKDTDDVTDIRCPQRIEDLDGQDKLCYDSDIKVVNILLLGLLPGTRVVAPTFLPTDDPISSLNKAMIFLSRQSQGYAGNAGNNQASGARVINTVGNARANQPRVVRCYNGNGEGHIAKQCITKKRMKDSEWFKDKMLLAQAQESGVVLNKEQQDFLADNLEETNDSTTNAIFMENLSPVGSLNDDTVEPCYDSDMLFKIPYYDTYYDSDMLNSNVQKLGYIENIVSNNESYDELTERDVNNGNSIVVQNAEPGIKKIDVPSTLAAPMLTVGHNAKKRKTSHSKWNGKATKGKSDRGSKRKVESEIAPTSDLKEAVCFYCNIKGHWKHSCPKYLKDLKDGKVEKGYCPSIALDKKEPSFCQATAPAPVKAKAELKVC